MKKLENIQLLRALACLGVFITHAAPRMGASGLAAKAANFGASGVYLFFLISGYLVCMQKGIGPGSSAGELKNYYIKRLLRVLPLYYAVVLFNILLHGVLLRDVTPDPGGLYWLRYFFLTNALIPAPDNFWSNLSATWTISLFVGFYLTAPLWRRLIRGVKSGAAVYLAALLLRYFWAETPVSGYMMLFYYLHFFLLGMCLWQIQQKAGGLGVKGLGNFGALVLAAWAIPKVCGFAQDYFTAWSWFFAAVLLLTQNLTLKEGGFRRCVLAVDRYSYSIYLVHAAVIDCILLLQGKIQLPALAVLLLAVGLTATGVAAAEILIERPAKKVAAHFVHSDNSTR